MLPEHIKRWRRQHITASDVPVLLGMSKQFGVTARDLYHWKVDGIEIDESEAMDVGKRLEPALLKRFAEVHNVTVNRQNTFRTHSNGVLSCTVDAFIPESREIVEAKTHGLLSGRISSDEWGDPGTDEVPDSVLVQVITQMGVVSDQTGEPWTTAHVTTLMPNRGFVDYQVTFCDEVFQHIKQEAERFWHEHIQPQVPPADVFAGIDTLEKLHVGNRSVAPHRIDDKWFKAYQEGHDMEKQGLAQKQEAKAAMITEMGPQYDEAETTAGNIITWREQSRRSLDTKKLQTEFADAYNACQQVAAFRVLRTKPLTQKTSQEPKTAKTVS